MKILLIITKSEVGGAQKSVFNLASYYKQAGHDVSIGSGEQSGFLNDFSRQENIGIFYFKKLKRTNNPLKNILFTFELQKFLGKNSFDIVHFNSSNTLFGAIGAKLARKKPKTVFTFRGMSLLDPNYRMAGGAKFLYICFFKTMMRFVDKAVFVSKQNEDLARRLKISSKGLTIYNGLNQKNLNFLDKNSARQSLEEKIGKGLENKFILGSIGRLAYQKNYEFLINTFPDILKKHPETILIVFGDGPNRKKYENLIKQKSLSRHIFLAGSDDEAYKYIPGFDLFVLPSRYEGMSITLIEALFAGSPLLVSDVGGNSEMLEEKSPAQTYRLDDKNDFLEKLNEVQKKLSELSKYNKHISENFSINNTAEKYLDLYKKITD